MMWAGREYVGAFFLRQEEFKLCNTRLIHQDTLNVPTVNGHKQTQALIVNLNIDIPLCSS